MVRGSVVSLRSGRRVGVPQGAAAQQVVHNIESVSGLGGQSRTRLLIAPGIVCRVGGAGTLACAVQRFDERA